MAQHRKRFAGISAFLLRLWDGSGLIYSVACHSHPHWQRTESHNRGFFRSALHTAHDLIHMVLLHLESDKDLDSLIATGLSFDCQMIVCT